MPRPRFPLRALLVLLLAVTAGGRYAVETDDGRVFVFGAGSLGFYVHCFDASDGKSLLHFSSRY